MGDVMYKIWASWRETERVASGDPLTRLRGICPECGNRSLHLYPHGPNPGYEVFLWCECGYGDFADRGDWVVRSARPFMPAMFANGYFRGLARQLRTCPACHASQTELLDRPDPNSAHQVCPKCGNVEIVMAPVRVERRGRDARRRRAKHAGQKQATLIQFVPRDTEL